MDIKIIISFSFIHIFLISSSLIDPPAKRPANQTQYLAN